MDPVVEVDDLVRTFPAPGGGTLTAVHGTRRRRAPINAGKGSGAIPRQVTAYAIQTGLVMATADRLPPGAGASSQV
jgi:hypothetical protein